MFAFCQLTLFLHNMSQSSGLRPFTKLVARAEEAWKSVPALNDLFTLSLTDSDS